MDSLRLPLAERNITLSRQAGDEPFLRDQLLEHVRRLGHLRAGGAKQPQALGRLAGIRGALEQGGSPLARHAEVAEALAKCLDGLEFVQRAAPQLDQQVADQGTALSAITGELATTMPLGDFRIIREIGRGGMGVVYEAEQLSLGRRVALKVLPFAAALDSRQLQRFKNEAQAAAHLHHTNIVPVFGVGCERGVHFYAMQYIEGQTLAQVIADLKLPRVKENAPDNSLPARGDAEPASTTACTLMPASVPQSSSEMMASCATSTRRRVR